MNATLNSDDLETFVRRLGWFVRVTAVLVLIAVVVMA